MQIGHIQITKPQTETFPFSSKRKSTKEIFYHPDVEAAREAFSDALAVAMLDTIEDPQKTLEKLAEDIFPRREKDISIIVGRKHYKWLLKNDFAEIKLKREKPLEIMFEKGEELILAYNDTFNLSGVGATREEALKDLIDFFIHDYFSYKDTPPEKLSKEAKLLLQQYEDVIEIHTKL